MSELHKFLFDGLPVRGMLVRLTDSWKTVLKRREGIGAFPQPVRELLGEMAAASTLITVRRAATNNARRRHQRRIIGRFERVGV